MRTLAYKIMHTYMKVFVPTYIHMYIYIEYDM